MKNEFGLLKLDTSKSKDSLTGRVSIYETPQFRIPAAVIFATILAILTLDILNFDVPNWLEFTYSFSFVLAYSVTLLIVFVSKDAGTVTISSDSIQIDPKKNSDKYPEKPVPINKDSVIRVSIIQAWRFISSRTLLHVNVTNGDTTSEFGMILKNKKKIEQYKDLLDSWYRAGYDLKESDQIGQRIFKLNLNTKYADVQKIKEEYSLDW